MASSTDHGSLVVSSNLTRPPWKRFVKKSELPHVKNLQNTFGSPEIGTTCWWHVGSYNSIRSVPGGESAMRLSLGRRLVNLLPVTQRTNPLTSCSRVTDHIQVKKKYTLHFLAGVDGAHMQVYYDTCCVDTHVRQQIQEIAATILEGRQWTQSPHVFRFLLKKNQVRSM